MRVCDYCKMVDTKLNEGDYGVKITFMDYSETVDLCYEHCYHDHRFNIALAATYAAIVLKLKYQEREDEI